MSRRHSPTTAQPTSLDLVYAAYQADPVFASLRVHARFVPGEGNTNRPDLLLIGEAPGQVEDQLGRPFVGPAGRVLDDLIQRAGLHRADLFITNVVKYRPPGNRFGEVTPDQLAASTRYLVREVDAVAPGLVVLLGGRALQSVFPTKRINRDRGRLLCHGGRRFYALLHPAVALYDPARKTEMVAEFRAMVAQAANRPVGSTRQEELFE